MQAGGRAAEIESSEITDFSHPAGGARIMSAVQEPGRGLGTEGPKNEQRHHQEQRHTLLISRPTEAGEVETGKYGEVEAQQTQQQHVQSCGDSRRAATQGCQRTLQGQGGQYHPWELFKDLNVYFSC